MNSNLYVIAAPSGAGKTSLVDALCQKLSDIVVSISHTTRAPRPGEVDGQNYFFVEKEQFQQHIKENLFLEHAEVFGNYYGTSKSWVEQQLQAGKDVILEIDWQGARQIKNMFSNSIGIFILPPSREVLAERLQKRAQDDKAVIAKRMKEASSEMSHYQEYEYLVVNDNFDEALEQLKSVIVANRCKQPIQSGSFKALIEALLS